MKYFLQVSVMFGDLAFIFLSAILLYECRNDFSSFIVAAILITLALKSWMNTGGFIAWRPKSVSAFFKNAKRYGL